ncbi:MAG: DUF3137 domain-containing protein [Planctomycetota bacterium]
MGLLRKIFGPSKKEIWTQIGDEIDGDYIEGGFWKNDSLRYRAGEWELVLDTFTVSDGKTSSTYTRLRAPFVNKDGLYFKIYREGFFSSIGKFFGMQDIAIGDPYFDDTFVIKGNDEEKIRLLLRDEELKDLFSDLPHANVEIRDDEGWFGANFPEGVDQLYYVVGGVVTEKARLKKLFELFSRLLERLVQIDSAYEDDPGVELK